MLKLTQKKNCSHTLAMLSDDVQKKKTLSLDAIS